MLIRAPAVTELIINFDTDGLRRIADVALSKNTDAKSAETNRQHVTNILGSDKWYDEFEKGGLETKEREELLLAEYENNLKKYGFQVVSYAIRSSLETPPKYHFVF